jgi:hypothetical protein
VKEVKIQGCANCLTAGSEPHSEDGTAQTTGRHEFRLLISVWQETEARKPGIFGLATFIHGIEAGFRPSIIKA